MSSEEAVLSGAAAGSQRVRQELLAATGWCPPLLALGLGVWSLRRADAGDIGSLGLVTALRPAVYAALAVLTVSFVVGVFRPRPASGRLLAGHVVVLVTLLHGAPAMIEPLPHMVNGWLHVGFADYIARTGATLPQLDARFNWPGFFGRAQPAVRRGRLPVGRQLSPDARTAWLAVWLFVATKLGGAGLLRAAGDELPVLPGAGAGAGRVVRPAFR